MHQKWQRPLIEACKREIARYLDELDRTDDLDLWEETAAKMNDVLVVFRRLQEPSGRIRLTPGQMAEAAFCAAIADFADEIENEMTD